MICFEFPLVERVRIFLRLEALFERFNFLLAQDAATAHHYAVHCVFEIMDCVSRADLKSDLLQEIERQKQNFTPLLNQVEVDQDKLKDLLSQLNNLSTQLQANHQKFGSHLRENEWLMVLKQKISMSGGASQFDFPSFHYWLQSACEKRRADLELWIKPLNPTSLAVNELLKILRESTANQSLVALKGQYQRTGIGERVHLLRVFVDNDLHAVPEVSANKYATNIRFMHESTTSAKGWQVDKDIPFQLGVCRF